MDPRQPWTDPQTNQAPREPRKYHGEQEVRIVGEDSSPDVQSPQRQQAAVSQDKRYALPRQPRIQDLVQAPQPRRSASYSSITPNPGDDTSSLNAHKNTMSEGEAVTNDLRGFNIQDPQSPSSPISGTASPTQPSTQKRPSQTDQSEGNPRPAKLHTRARSGSDVALLRGTIQNSTSTNVYDPVRDNQGQRSYPRPITPRANRPSHLRNPYRSTSDVEGDCGQDPSVDIGLSDPQSESSPEMFKQPITRPITQDQLVKEVKGIYAGLVVVEKKCVEIDQQQATSMSKLTNEQYQALTALHRTLLHEHHDFFLASQHPSASPALKKLATKYAMPARMWRHGIHSFLELLRHRLPESLEHMLAFVYLAYSMMSLLMESVSSFEETWIECLGDLARYRMAIEESDLRDREAWSGVAAMWYNRAADKSPGVGRIQHHLAVLARPNIVQQLFYYTKALVTLVPFQNARESIMLLFNQFLEPKETASQRYYPVESALVKSHGIMFVKGSIGEFEHLAEEFLAVLDDYLGRVTAKFRVQGPEMAVSILAGVLAFGDSEGHLFQLLRSRQSSHATTELPEDLPPAAMQQSVDETQKMADVQWYWTQHGLREPTHPHARSSPQGSQEKFAGPDDITYYALVLMGRTMRIIFSRIGDKNTLSFNHVMLASLWSLACVPGAMEYVQAFVPWQQVALFLNTLGRHGAARAEKPEVARPGSGPGRQLPEDFVMRGLLWTVNYYPQDFFQQLMLPEDERNLELPSHAVYRAERCLWLGEQLSSLNHWLHYNDQTKQFSVTEFGRNVCLPLDVPDPRSTTQSPSHDV